MKTCIQNAGHRQRTMHIGIAAPIGTEYVAHLLDEDSSTLPQGYGGAPLIGTLIDGLLARGHRVTAFTTSGGLPLPGHACHVAKGRHFSIHYAPVRARAFRPAGGHLGRAADAFRHERIALTQAMRQAAPDIVHAHWTYEFGLAALASGLPHVITCHDSPAKVLRYMPGLYRLVRYFMARQCLANAQCVTAVSPYLRDEILDLCRVPVHMVPNPLSPAFTERQGHAPRQIDPEAPQIVMVANGWGNLKNPIPALQAFARFHQRHPQARLHLFGVDYGPGEVAERWATAQGIQAGMAFFGKRPFTELKERIAAADAMIHPSLEETFGMSIAEAMALGVPVIGGAHSGAVPWVIGEGGVLVDVRSADAIHAGLTALLDPTAFPRYRQVGMALVRDRFAVEAVVSAFEQLYFEQLIHRSSLSTSYLPTYTES